MNTFADVKVGDFISDPETGLAGLVLSIAFHPEYGDIEFLLLPDGELFMRPDAEVVIYE